MDTKRFTVKDGKGFDPEDYPCSLKVDKELRPRYEQELERDKLEMQALQDKLYAEGREGLIIVLQAMDAAGKDSMIRHVLGGINPTGIDVRSFKQPSTEELAHGFLWRTFGALPARGKISVLNRSYYEECLVVRVNGLWRDYHMPKRCLDMDEERYFDERYEDIRGFERYLWRSGYRIVKLFLHVSAEKQRERFLERIDDESKNWKFSENDLSERVKWNEYRRAYRKMIAGTATSYAPWYVIPADQKWVARSIVAQILVDTLRDMDPRYPELPQALHSHLAACREALVSGAAADVDE